MRHSRTKTSNHCGYMWTMKHAGLNDLHVALTFNQLKPCSSRIRRENWKIDSAISAGILQASGWEIRRPPQRLGSDNGGDDDNNNNEQTCSGGFHLGCAVSIARVSVLVLSGPREVDELWQCVEIFGSGRRLLRCDDVVEVGYVDDRRTNGVGVRARA